jgi:hypothetical protein
MLTQAARWPWVFRSGGRSWRERWWAALFLGWTARPPRRLRLCETLALGDRQFLSVVEFEEERFLIGRSSSSVVLVAQLPKAAMPAPLPELDGRGLTAITDAGRRP